MAPPPVPGARPRLRGAGAIVVAALAAALLAACGHAGPVAPPAPSQAIGTRLDAAVPSRVLALPFRDSTGRTRHLSDFAGKVLVLSDSMTLCQESCPLDTSSVVRAARQVAAHGAADDVEFLTVTVDPGRDTPRRLAAYRTLFRPTPANWLTLTGSAPHVRALWKAFGVYTKRVPDDSPAPHDWLTGKPLAYDVEHSDEVFFLDAGSHERFVLDGIPAVHGRSSLPSTLYQFLSRDGRRNVLHPKQGTWTPAQALRVIDWLAGHRVAA